MLDIRKAGDRGRSRFDWLDSRHTFSFAHYYDPRFMGHGTLRVINDDRVAPGGGFGTHPHRDMEIITFVLDGALEHRDSMGNGSVIRPGEIQRMSAGTGITHSEYNHSREAAAHFLQIWILPERQGLAPGYEQKAFSPEDSRGRFRKVVARSGADGALRINQDVDLYLGRFDGAETATFKLRENRDLWVHVARGSIRVGDERLEAGDGAAARAAGSWVFSHGDGAEVLLFDMARRQ